MKIRLADISDIDSLMEIKDRCIESLERENIYQWDDIYPAASDFKGDIVEQSLYVITGNGEVFGGICINQSEDLGYSNATWDGSRFLVIHKLMVDPARKSKGMGRFAMAFAEQLAQERNMDSMRLDCFRPNKRANLFYQKLGYSIKGETKFRKGWFNLYEKVF